MQTDINELEYCLFDTETTGLNPQTGDRIIEIAALRWKGDQEGERFHSLINPGRPVSPAAFAVNNISDQMLSGAPRADTVLPRFRAFIKDSCLCSYNLPFDLGFLNAELALLGEPPVDEARMVDILTMARRLLPLLESHSLRSVARHLGITDEQAHRAFSDVQMTREVFRRLEPFLRRKGLARVETFLHFFSVNRPGMADRIAATRAKVQEAIDQGLRIAITYCSRSSGELSQRQVLPKEIKAEGRTEYVVGFCCLRNEERTFRLDSIVELEVV